MIIHPEYQDGRIFVLFAHHYLPDASVPTANGSFCGDPVFVLKLDDFNLGILETVVGVAC